MLSCSSQSKKPEWSQTAGTQRPEPSWSSVSMRLPRVEANESCPPPQILHPLASGWEHTPSDTATSVVLSHRAVASPHWVCMEVAIASPQLFQEQLGRYKISPMLTQWGDATGRCNSMTEQHDATLHCVRTLSPHHRRADVPRDFTPQNFVTRTHSRSSRRIGRRQMSRMNISRDAAGAQTAK